MPRLSPNAMRSPWAETAGWPVDPVTVWPSCLICRRIGEVRRSCGAETWRAHASHSSRGSQTTPAVAILNWVIPIPLKIRRRRSLAFHRRPKFSRASRSERYGLSAPGITGHQFRRSSRAASLSSSPFPIPPSVLSGRCEPGKINHCACRTDARVFGTGKGNMLKLRSVEFASEIYGDLELRSVVALCNLIGNLGQTPASNGR